MTRRAERRSLGPLSQELPRTTRMPQPLVASGSQPARRVARFRRPRASRLAFSSRAQPTALVVAKARQSAV